MNRIEKYTKQQIWNALEELTLTTRSVVYQEHTIHGSQERNLRKDYEGFGLALEDAEEVILGVD